MTQAAVYIIIGIFVAGIIIYLLRRRHVARLPMDDMDGREFEEYCAQILEKAGFIEPDITPGSHDYGVDIITEKDGVSYAFQCKCYSEPVGVAAVMQIYAGRDYYDKMVGVVMTNQYFTGPAVKMAEKLNILLWDRGYVEELERELGLERR